MDDYLGFLQGGCSKDPLDLLRDAGVDMEQPEPVDTALDYFGPGGRAGRAAVGRTVFSNDRSERRHRAGRARKATATPLGTEALAAGSSPGPPPGSADSPSHQGPAAGLANTRPLTGRIIRGPRHFVDMPGEANYIARPVTPF